MTLWVVEVLVLDAWIPMTGRISNDRQIAEDWMAEKAERDIRPVRVAAYVRSEDK